MRGPVDNSNLTAALAWSRCRRSREGAGWMGRKLCLVRGLGAGAGAGARCSEAGLLLMLARFW